MLTTDQVAKRLGVKPTTVYAYVSRGLLTSHRNTDGKGSLFDEADVARFAAGRSFTPPPIETGITLIRDGRLFYRGHDAAALATTTPFESVVTLLWSGSLPEMADAPDTEPADSSPSAVSRGQGVVTRPADSPPSAVLRGQVFAARPDSPASTALRGQGAVARPADSPALAALRGQGAVARPAGSPASAASRGQGAVARPADSPASAAPRGRASAAQLADWSISAAPPARPFAYPPLVAPPELVSLVRAVTESLPAAARLTDRLRVAVAAAAAGDPLRFDITPAAVVLTGQALLATMARALPRVGAEPALSGPPPGLGSPPGVFALDRNYPDSLASILWPRLTTLPSTSERLTALNAALVLLADHDIAASTLAARVAASTRAHPYAVVSAGLAVLDGPLHGAASGLAHDLLVDALSDNDPIRALARFMQSGRPVPGFGHPLYPDGDPRAVALLSLILREDDENSRDDASMLWEDQDGSRDVASISRNDGGGFRDDASIPRNDGGGFRGDASIPRAKEGGFGGDASIPRKDEGGFRGDTSVSPGEEGGFRGDALLPRAKEGGFRGDALLPQAKDYGFRGDASVPRAKEDGPRYDAEPRLAVIRGVLDAMARRSGPRPNVDFALAALTLLSDMPADAGEAIFAIARTAGWIAHALEEYADRPLRFRPNGRYAGPEPG